MTIGLSFLSQIYFYVGLIGFIGCFLSFFLSLNIEKGECRKCELLSCFLLGTSFTGVLLVRLIPSYLLLNIIFSLSVGILSSIVANSFLKVSLKKSFDHEIEV